MGAANSVWLPRPPLPVIQAGTSPLVYGWAPADIAAAITAIVPSVPGVIINPMTTWGDLIYGGQTPAGVPTRLGAGASGTYLKSNGVGAAPSWATVAGADSLSQTPGADWGWAGPGASATNITGIGCLSSITPTATDSTSSNNSNYAVGVATPYFEQSTSGVLNNTTVLAFLSGAAVTVPGLVASARGPIWACTFAINDAASAFAINFGRGQPSLGTTATLHSECAGVCRLSGATNMSTFANAGNLVDTGVAPVANNMYTVVVDLRDFATQTRILLWNWPTQTWIADRTYVGALAANSIGFCAIYMQATAAAVKKIYHHGIGVHLTGFPRSLP